MSKMLRLELVGLVLLACTQILTEHHDFYAPYNQYGHQRHQQEWQEKSTKNVRVQQGLLEGMVVRPLSNPNLQRVDVFLGVPYAEPPVSGLRFQPPKSPQTWRYVRKVQEFAPVCPQVLPEPRLEIQRSRHENLKRLLPYLRNQSEDCLYLNIYAPHQNDGSGNVAKYPVMVFIQGESYEWNSGNAYDGTVISAHGKVVFVTINFRLGILGFLKPGITDKTSSNFGLMDQTAALLWLRENIGKFGGDPDTTTLVGHGTGAIFANLLLISPVANDKNLFRRAILMSGSALSSDAIGRAPFQMTLQVAHALNCPADENDDDAMAACLRSRDLDALLNVKIHKPAYVPAFAPLIDRVFIPDEPLQLMQNPQIFGGFDLMYGVTESEKYHLLPTPYAVHGMLDDERDNVLRDHAKATHVLEPELALSKILGHYGDFTEGYPTEYEIKNRDLVLDALSDSGTVAPLMRVADLHSRANPKSYMYVFSHPNSMQDYSDNERQRTVHGEEIPYILGDPLDGNRYPSRGWDNSEALFSEVMMTWWCNFAYTGNPNVPRRSSYMTDGPRQWIPYEINWPEYTPQNRTYLNLTNPPNVGTMYRASEMKFWTEDLPNVVRHRPTGLRPSGRRPPILDYADRMGNNLTVDGSRFSSPSIKYPSTSFDNIHYRNGDQRSPDEEKSDSSMKPSESESVQGSSAITLVIGACAIFAIVNITAFFYLYLRRHSLKGKEKQLRRRLNNEKGEGGAKRLKSEKQYLDNGADVDQKSESKVDINEVIKNDKAYDNNSNFGRRSKLSRHNSNSTIDTHIKVKEWIQQEIVHRCSPRFLRKTRETLQKEHQEKLTKQQELEEDEDRRRSEEERLQGLKDEPIYDQSPALVVRPGKKSKLPKVSVAIDATPAMRTESILNQFPIELAKDLDMINELGGPYDMELENIRSPPQVVVIEHHHSRSDPLPMENVFKTVKPNFSTTRIYESDSGSASSLYAKINPKLKTRLPRLGTPGTPEEEITDNQQVPKTPEEDLYGKTVPKLRTFGSNEQPGDINVTCREPTREREIISPEEALKTIKRRNYPKVLPDIEKRRSLPAPNSLFVPKLYGTLSKDHRHAGISGAGNPPPPPPRMFGTSKSLDLAEEVEDREPITTNLHVGPLLKRQDSTSRNNSDPNLIDSFERVAIDAQEVLSNHRVEYGDNHGSGGIPPNPKCPLHGTPYLFSAGTEAVETNTSQSVDCLDRNLGNPNWYRMKDSAVPSRGVPNSSLPDIIGNPNWYKPSVLLKGNTKKDASTEAVGSTENNYEIGKPIQNHDTKSPSEPKIVITPRLGNLLGQSGQNLSHNLSSLTTPKNIPQEPKIVITQKPMPDRLATTEKGKLTEPITPTNEQKTAFGAIYPPVMSNISKEERHEPKIIITPKDSKHTATGSNIKQPKIIIKPTTNVQRNRDQRNIPKVSAIPSPEIQNFQNFEKDTKGPENLLDANLRFEKPPIKEKPKVTRIPSFSRRKDERNGDQSVYHEKSEVIQRVNAVPTSKVTGNPLNIEKSNATTQAEKKTDSSGSTSNSSNSNTNTIKRKPLNKK